MNALLKPGGALGIAFFAILFAALMGKGLADEMPIGKIGGTVLMLENKKPLAGATVILSSTIVGADERIPDKVAKADAKGDFSFTNVPEGTYRIDAYSKSHQMDPATIFVRAYKTETVTLLADPTAPELDIYINQHVFLPTEQPELQAHGYSTSREFELDFYKLSKQEIIAKGGLRGALQPLSNATLIESFITANGGAKVRSMKQSISGRDVEGVFRNKLQTEPLPAGVYWVSIRAGDAIKGSYLIVSSIALISKNAGRQGLAFVTDLATGTPRQGAKLSVAAAGKSMEVGETDADGVKTFTFPVANDQDRPILYAEYGDSIAFVDSWISDNEQGPIHMGFVTDRSVYRPGDTVQFKGILRKMGPDGYQTVAGGTADVTFADQDGENEQNLKLAVDDRGAFSGSFKTSEYAVGAYQLSAKMGDSSTSRYVTIAAYRKPEFKLLVTPEKPYFIAGERVRMKAAATYYFGGPVAGAKFSAYVYAKPKYEPDPNSEWEGDWDDSSYSGEFIEELTEVTAGPDGTASFEFDTAKLKEQMEFDDCELTFEVTGTEAGDKYFDAKGRVTVRRGDLSLRTELDSWIAERGSEIEVSCEATDNDGKPQSGVAVTFDYGYENFDGKVAHFQRQGGSTAVTDASGKAQAKLPVAESRSLLIRAWIQDARGNRIASNQYVWVTDSPVEAEAGPRLDLVLDQKGYEVGETAHGLVGSAAPGAAVLVCVEADTILHHQVMSLGSGQTEFDLPIARKFLPNARVTLTSVQQKRLVQAGRNIKVEWPGSAINVAVTADRERVRPGESIGYTIRTTDMKGLPVDADVALSVVDESVYAIREDSNNLFNDFFPSRYSRVETNYSFPELYLDGGDKTPPNVEVRQNFRDTAYWNPTIRTGPQGIAQVTVQVPDNLGSWRATAYGIVGSAASGVGKCSVIASKDLMVRLQAAQHYVQGDEVEISAALNLGVAGPSTVKVSIKTASLEFTTSRDQTITLEQGVTGNVRWNAKAVQPGLADITVIAWVDGGPNDAMSLKVPIAVHGREQVTEQFVELKTGIQELAVKRIAGAEHGELKLSLMPSLVHSLVSALPGLIDYPYGCTEQTVSRFVPAILAAELMRDLGLQSPAALNKLPEIVEKSYAKLKELRHWDGGWGWWRDDATSPIMTAIVLEGLYFARSAGHAPNPEWITGAIQYAKNLPLTDKLDPDETAFLAYSCSLFGASAEAARLLTAVEPKVSSSAAKAFTAMAWTQHARANPQNQEAANKAKAASEALLKSITVTNGTPTVEQRQFEYLVSSSARSLQALLTLGVGKDRVLPLVRVLMQRRRGDMWATTVETAQILAAIRMFVPSVQSGDESSAIAATLGEVQLVPKSPFRAGTGTIEKRIPIKEVPLGESKLRMEKFGAGGGFASLTVRQTPFEADLGTAIRNGDFRVERSFHSLEARKDDYGNLRLTASRNPQTSFQSGQPVRLKVSIFAESPLKYVMIVVPTPANLRSVEADDPDFWGWWWSGMQIFDNRVAIFISDLYPGERTIELNYRAEAPGRCSALPASMELMYDPAVRASTPEVRLEVRP